MPKSSSPPVVKKKSPQAVGTYNLRYRTPRNASQNAYGGKYGFIGDVIVSASNQQRIASGSDSTSKHGEDKHQSESSGSGSHVPGNPSSSTNEGGNNSARALYNITGPFSITNAAQPLITGPSHSNSSTGSPSTRSGLLNDIVEEGAPRRPVRPHREYRETFITFSPENEAEHAVQNTSPTDTSSTPLEEVHDTLDTSKQEENTPSAPEQPTIAVTETPSPKASSPLLDPDMPIDERISAMLKELQDENDFAPSSRYTINRWNMARATLSDFDFETSGPSYNKVEDLVMSTFTNNDEQAQHAAAPIEVVAPLNIRSLKSTKPSNTKAPLLSRKRLPAPIITDFTNTNALNKETSAFRPVATSSAGASMSATKEPTNQATSQKQYPMSPVAKGKQPINMSNRLVSPATLHRMNQTAEVAEASGSKQLASPVDLPRMNQIPGVPEARKQSGETKNTTGLVTSPGPYQMSEVARGKQPMKMSNQLTDAVILPRMNQRNEVGEGSGLKNQAHGVSEGRKPSGESRVAGSVTSPGPYQISEVARGKQPMNMSNQRDGVEMGEGSGSRNPGGPVGLPKMDQVYGVSEGRKTSSGSKQTTSPVTPPGQHPMSAVAKGKQPANRSKQLTNPGTASNADQIAAAVQASRLRGHARVAALPRMNRVSGSSEVWDPESEPLLTANPVKAKKMYPLMPLPSGEQPVGMSDRFVGRIRPISMAPRLGVEEVGRFAGLAGHRAGPVTPPGVNPVTVGAEMEAPMSIRGVPYTPPRGDWAISGAGGRGMPERESKDSTTALAAGILASTPPSTPNPVSPPPSSIPAATPPPQVVQAQSLPASPTAESVRNHGSVVFPVRSHSLPDLKNPTGNFCLPQPPRHRPRPDPTRLGAAFVPLETVPEATVPQLPPAFPAPPPSPPSSPVPASPTNTPPPLAPTQQPENRGASPAASVPQGPFAGYASFQEAMAAVERSRMEEAGGVSPTEDTLTDAETALLSYEMLAGPFPGHGSYEAAIASSRGAFGGAPARVLGRSGGPAGRVKKFFGLFRGRGGKGGSGGV